MIRLARSVYRLRPGGLWRHPDFLKLWLGQSVSMFGSEITPIALPLVAALTIQATPAQMAFLRAMQYVPAVLVGLFVGVWVDRVRRRPLMIGADIGRAALLLAICAVAALGLLRMELLYIVAFLMGVLGLLFSAAYVAFLPALVRHEQLVEGNSKLATSGALAQISGPGLAGGLVQLLTAPGAVAIDGLSFLASALSLAFIRAPEPALQHPAQHRRLRAEVAEGLRTLLGDRYLRAFVASSATLDVFWNALMVVYFLYVIRDLGLAPGAIGLIFSVGSVGGLLGSLAASRVARGFGLGPAIVGAQLILGIAGLLIILAVLLPAYALPLLIAAEFVQSGMNMIYTINRTSLALAITPDQLRGRVSASTAFLGMAAVALGSLLGGVLGERIGLPATMIVGSCGGLIAFMWVLLSPVRSLRELPPAPESV